MRSTDPIIFLDALQGTDTIYHYTDAGALLSIVEKQELWATKRDFLNDEDEWRYTFRLFSEEILSQIKNGDGKKRLQQAFLESVNADWFDLPENKRLVGQYIVSFSTDMDNLTLWSEFSGSMGYSIAFSCEGLRDGIPRHYTEGAVIYDRQTQIKRLQRSLVRILSLRPEVYRKRTLEELAENPTDDELEFLAMDLSILCAGYAAFFKNAEFSAEKEYRFTFHGFHIKSVHGGKLDKMEFRQKDNLVLPYIRVPFQRDKAIKSIITGPKNSHPIAMQGIRHLCRYYGLDASSTKSKIPLQR